MSILDRMDEERIFTAEGRRSSLYRKEPHVFIYEGCDYKFTAELSFEEFRQLGRDIIAKADQLERDLAAPATNTADKKE